MPACLFFGWIVDKYDRRKNGEILAASMTLLLVIMALLCAWLYRPVPGLGVPDYVVVAVLLLAAPRFHDSFALSPFLWVRPAPRAP